MRGTTREIYFRILERANRGSKREKGDRKSKKEAKKESKKR